MENTRIFELVETLRKKRNYIRKGFEEFVNLFAQIFEDLEFSSIKISNYYYHVNDEDAITEDVYITPNGLVHSNIYTENKDLDPDELSIQEIKAIIKNLDLEKVIAKLEGIIKDDDNVINKLNAINEILKN